ncbi:hypothetical protein KDA00_00945 [Candidatus Saccharibacteria bacterium]|nr:hypothetical protein [Candidatus Saccharibacteria bacterium]
MANYKKKADFFDTEEGNDFIKALKTMVKDNSYYTEPTFSANSELYPDQLIPFVDKHVQYISNHSLVNPQHYLANLRIITKVRR